MQSEYNTSGCSLQIKNQKHLQNMEELLEIYKRIEDLRNKGVKMCCLLSIQVCCPPLQDR